MQKQIRTYYSLTKPGIIYGNLMTAGGGFLLASRGHVDPGLLVAALGGIALVIASACVFNNYIDRGIDKKMARTRKRALVSGEVSGPAALTYATLLGLAGFAILALYTNLLTVLLGVAAIVDYVILYGISKRRSVHGTVVGSIAGALPVTAGYTAVTNSFDTGALLLFLILVCWQMPHFYAIAIYRLDDYKAAGLPVLPAKTGLRATKRQMVAYIVAFIIAAVLLTAFGYTGYVYLLVMLALGLWWLQKSLRGFRVLDSKRWARGLFGVSLVIITAFSVLIAVDNLLP